MNDETPQNTTPSSFEVWTPMADERYKALIAELPKTLPVKQYVRYCQYAFRASRLSRKQRARVVFPWRPRPASVTAETRVKRGNPRRNPTVLQ